MENIVVNVLIIILILVVFFYLLYWLGGESIIFFRKKKVKNDPEAGEKVLAPLQRFARVRSYRVLPDLTLYYKGEGAHYDAVLVGYFGVLFVTAMGQGGEVYGSDEEEQWLQVFEEERSRFENPGISNSQRVKVMRAVLSDAGLKIPVLEGMTVFTQKDAVVNVPRSTPHMRLEDLGSNIDKAKYITDNGVEIEKVVEALEKYRQ